MSYHYYAMYQDPKTFNLVHLDGILLNMEMIDSSEKYDALRKMICPDHNVAVMSLTVLKG